MIIIFIIAAAIIVILLCREAILHKGDFFERAIMAAGQIPTGDTDEIEDPDIDRQFSGPLFGQKELLGTLPGDPGYDE